MRAMPEELQQTLDDGRVEFSRRGCPPCSTLRNFEGPVLGCSSEKNPSSIAYRSRIEETCP